MRQCRMVKRLLSRYLDGEINKVDAMFVSTHLKQCPFCEKELSGLGHIKELVLQKEYKLLPGDYFVCRLRDKIIARQYADKKMPWTAALGELSRKFIPLPVTAIVLLMLAANVSFRPAAYQSGLSEHIFRGTQATTDMAIELVLGVLR